MSDIQKPSLDRIKEFGEVYTSQEQVVDMLDLVKHETERIDSRFFEPACGDGNFLIEVIRRKLDVLKHNLKNNRHEFEKNLIVAVGSIYGIDILLDNVEATRERIFKEVDTFYKNIFPENPNSRLVDSIKFIIDKNIIHGDALTLLKADSNKPVTFCEWGLFKNKIKRRDFTLADLLAHAPFEEGTLFSDLGDDFYIPKPIKEHKIVNFDRVFDTC